MVSKKIFVKAKEIKNLNNKIENEINNKINDLKI